MKYLFNRLIVWLGFAFRWRALMLLGGVSLLAQNTACRSKTIHCYTGPPTDTTHVEQPTCYGAPAGDTTLNPRALPEKKIDSVKVEPHGGTCYLFQQ